jgi:hypothetical protein
MKIKIANTTDGSPVITEALAVVNGRAAAATATAVSIIDAAIYAESKLHALGIPKNKRTGATFRYTSGGSVARSYKYSRIVNVVTAVRGSAGWFITNITKSDLFPNQSGETKLGLKPEQIEIAVAQVRSQFYAA